MIRWRDGFSIDGGELRLYSDPASREFMVGVEKRELGTLDLLPFSPIRPL